MLKPLGLRLRLWLTLELNALKSSAEKVTLDLCRSVEKRTTKELNPIRRSDSINNMRLDIVTKHFTNNKLQKQQL